MQTVRFKSAADYATAEIQRMILQGQLKAGERVDQEELAARLELSRHPIRQAIERLGERGFIALRPHRSAVVAEISVADMDELYHAREKLERMAAYESWDRLDDAARARIAALEEQVRGTDPLVDLDGFMQLNRAFHFALYEPGGNRYILRAVTALYDLSERYQRLALQRPARARQSGADHAAIVSALMGNDREALIACIRSHNAGTQVAVREQLQALAHHGGGDT